MRLLLRIENIVGKVVHAYSIPVYLAPLAVGQQAYVMTCCPSGVRPCVRPSMH